MAIVAFSSFAAAAEKEAPVNPSELGETAVGDMVADVMRAATGADAALINAGSLGFDDLPAKVTDKNVDSIVPFGEDTVVVLKLKGEDLLAALERSVSVLPRRFSGFLQVSGISLLADTSLEKGSRIVKAEINGEAIDPDAEYTVAVTGFLSTGGGGYMSLKNGKPASDKTFSLETILVDSAAQLPKDADGRIRIREPKED